MMNKEKIVIGVLGGMGTYATINSCCAPLFEANLNNAGIKFNRIA